VKVVPALAEGPPTIILPGALPPAYIAFGSFLRTIAMFLYELFLLISIMCSSRYLSKRYRTFFLYLSEQPFLIVAAI